MSQKTTAKSPRPNRVSESMLPDRHRRRHRSRADQIEGFAAPPSGTARTGRSSVNDVIGAGAVPSSEPIEQNNRG